MLTRGTKYHSWSLLHFWWFTLQDVARQHVIPYFDRKLCDGLDMTKGLEWWPQTPSNNLNNDRWITACLLTSYFYKFTLQSTVYSGSLCLEYSARGGKVGIVVEQELCRVFGYQNYLKWICPEVQYGEFWDSVQWAGCWQNSNTKIIYSFIDLFNYFKTTLIATCLGWRRGMQLLYLTSTVNKQLICNWDVMKTTNYDENNYNLYDPKEKKRYF